MTVPLNFPPKWFDSALAQLDDVRVAAELPLLAGKPASAKTLRRMSMFFRFRNINMYIPTYRGDDAESFHFPHHPWLAS
jgi:hypothetical protein